MSDGVQLRFVGYNTAVSAMIRAVEYDFKFSHVECVLPDHRIIGAYDTKGVAIQQPDYDHGSSILDQNFCVVKCSAVQAQLFHDFLFSQLGKPYDYTAVAAFVADRNWSENDSWFCSELICAALVHAQILPAMPISVSKITPRDLYLILCAAGLLDNAAD